jgi:ABC-type transport system involved in multi-copper enzyme maturation permease subunit
MSGARSVAGIIGTAWRQLVDNPVALRDLRRTLGQRRTPVLLAAIGSLSTVLAAIAGEFASVSLQPADVGELLFHGCFSIVLFGVAWVAAGTTAYGIATERNNASWEPILLLAVGPRRLVIGKLIAKFLMVVLYLVMLLPVSLIAFIFGGVTVTEILSAFAWLMLLGLFWVGIGVAIGTRARSRASALVVSMLLTLPLSLLFFAVCGATLSVDHCASRASLRAEFPLTASMEPNAGILQNSNQLWLLVCATVVTLSLAIWLCKELSVAAVARVHARRASQAHR